MLIIYRRYTKLGAPPKKKKKLRFILNPTAAQANLIDLWFHDQVDGQ